ncbi:MAG: DNA-3-methyladenine glycosylase I [Halanaerobium sp.]|nr:DNA-3-methyladenine glycosylase I [Halanaerobium sp.]
MEKLERCPWCLSDQLYIEYHDQEWGVPVCDDCRQFEFLTLESAQAGLSWLTILKKRENYRQAYAGFDPAVVASYDEARVEELLQNEGIVRNKRKISASINNARRFLEIQAEFGSFSYYLWRFVDCKPLVNGWEALAEVPAKTELSTEISKDLKKRGFKFVGPTIIYAHLQATGLVNDHLVGCFRHQQCQEMPVKDFIEANG